jgi:hypothetical protein
MLNVNTLSVVMLLNVIMQIVIMLSVVMLLNVIMLSVVILLNVIQSVIMLSVVILLNVIQSLVIMLSVVAPSKNYPLLGVKLCFKIAAIDVFQQAFYAQACLGLRHTAEQVEAIRQQAIQGPIL